MLTITDIIGPARRIGEAMLRKCERARTNHQPMKLLLYGEPGIGKTELANLIARSLAGHEAGVESVNGADVTAEIVREWRTNMRTASLFCDWRVVVINEVDRMSAQAQVLMLTVLDELPPCQAFICTTNLQLGEMIPRFQSRFQQFQIDPPEMEDIADMLIKQAIPADTAYRIAAGANGNVRAALLDAESYRDLHG